VSVPRISAFARLANGTVAPIRTIEGQATKLSRTMHGIAYDDTHDEIVVPVALAGALLVFRGDASGEQPPVRVIQGTRTHIVFPHTVAVDPVNDEIITADPSMRSLFVFDRTANGNVPPKRVIFGPKTGLVDITGVAVDPVRHVIVASSRKGDKGPTGLFVFDRLANGDVPPLRFIGGARSKLAHFRQVAIDPATGNIFLAQQRTRMKPPDAYVLDKPREGADAESGDEGGSLDATGFIAVYGPGDTGDVPPRAIIKGPGIRLSGAGGVAVNPNRGEIYAIGGNGMTTYLLPDFFGDLAGRRAPATAERHR
jgi:DNA-binding beta-propeller fold protein YncE